MLPAWQYQLPVAMNCQSGHERSSNSQFHRTASGAAPTTHKAQVNDLTQVCTTVLHRGTEFSILMHEHVTH